MNTKGADGTEGKSSKYAFKIAMDLNEDLSKEFIIEITSLNFMIWSDSVANDTLKELGISTTQALLDQA